MAQTHYSPFTVQAGQVPSTQTNFPVVLWPTDNRFRTVAQGGNVSNNGSGFDIRPYSDAGLTTPLTYELVPNSYVATTGQFEMHVLVPSLADGYVIYVGYGDSALNTDGSSTGTWDSNFLGVWHLGIPATLSGEDSTSNNNDITTNQGATALAGKLGGGATFDGVNDQMSATIVHGIGTGDFTISAWVNATSIALYEGIMSFGTYAPNMAIRAASSPNNWGAYWGAERTSGFGPSTSTWYRLSMRRSGSEVTFFRDTAQESSNYTISTSISSNAFRLGNNGDTAWFDGGLDEARMSNSYRADSWLTTEYRNQNAPNGTFYVIGAEQTYSAGAAVPEIMNSYRQRRY